MYVSVNNKTFRGGIIKKLFKVLLTTILLTSLTACAPSTVEETATPTEDATTTSTDGSQKITVWAWDPNFNIAVMNEAAKAYNVTNPDVEVEVEEMAKADLEQKLHTTLASQTTNGLPEIVLIEDYNAQKYLNSYPGMFADLTDEINYSDFAAYKQDLMTVDGRKYGVPFDSGVSGMFYRTDVLAEAGLTADDLTDITWDQMIEVGKVVKEKTGKAFLGFGTTDGGIMRIMLQSAQSWYFDEAGQPALVGNDVLKEAMETYKKIIDSGIIVPTNGWNEWVGAFNEGTSVSVETGVWIVGSVKANADQSGLWGIAPIPRLNNANSVNASNLGGSSWYILDKSANKDLAIDFMNSTFGADTDFYQTILVNNGAMGTYLPATTGEAYAQTDDFFGGEAIYTKLAGWMEQIPSVNYGEYTYEADAAVMGQVESFVNGDQTIDEAIQNAQTQLEGQIQ